MTKTIRMIVEIVDTISMVAKPFTLPVPIIYRISAQIKVVTLRIENRNKGLGASLIKGGLYTTSGIQRVLDTLKCQNVGIGRHTDTKHEGRNTRQGKDCAHGIIDEEHDKDIGCQRDCGNQTRQTVVQNHEQHDQCDTDTASQHGFTEGVDTVIGSHRIAVFLTHFHRQRTGVDQILQLGCLLLGEASANLRTGRD